MEKKFNYNNDIIIYQNMMNEFEVLKNILLNEYQIEILKFISKVSINLHPEKQKKMNEGFKNIFEKIEYDFIKIHDNFPEMIKKYDENPYIYSKMITNIKETLNIIN